MIKINKLYVLLLFIFTLIMVLIFNKLNDYNKKNDRKLNAMFKLQLTSKFNYLAYFNKNFPTDVLFVKLENVNDTLYSYSYYASIDSISVLNEFDSAFFEYNLRENGHIRQNLMIKKYLITNKNEYRTINGDFLINLNANSIKNRNEFNNLYISSISNDSSIYTFVYDEYRTVDEIYEYKFLRDFWIIEYYFVDINSDYILVNFNGQIIKMEDLLSRD